MQNSLTAAKQAKVMTHRWNAGSWATVWRFYSMILQEAKLRHKAQSVDAFSSQFIPAVSVWMQFLASYLQLQLSWHLHLWKSFFFLRHIWSILFIYFFKRSWIEKKIFFRPNFTSLSLSVAAVACIYNGLYFLSHVNSTWMDWHTVSCCFEKSSCVHSPLICKSSASHHTPEWWIDEVTLQDGR